VSDDEDSFSTTEVARALSRLGAAEMLRLTDLSRVWTRRFDPSLADDLLNEAIQRAMDGRRRWSRSHDLLTFMSGTMRSIADEWRRKARRESPTAPDELAVLAPASASTQETAVILADLLEKVGAALGGHPPSLAVFTLRMMGATRREICAELGIDDTEFDSAYRRAQRELLRLFPEGCPS
jgi:DNA-directed RNA polymerase specialized sigma24 family protein